MNKTLKSIFFEAPKNSNRHRIMYHIGRRPASPKPFSTKKDYDDYDGNSKDFGWQHNKKFPTQTNGVFLSDNWISIWMNHGVAGNVYVYKIPMAAIEEAGGIIQFDDGREVFIPVNIWEKYNLSKTFLGKKYTFEEADTLLRTKGKYGWASASNGNKISGNVFSSPLADKKKKSQNQDITSNNSLDILKKMSLYRLMEVVKLFKPGTKEKLINHLNSLIEKYEKSETNEKFWNIGLQEEIKGFKNLRDNLLLV